MTRPPHRSPPVPDAPRPLAEAAPPRAAAPARARAALAAAAAGALSAAALVAAPALAAGDCPSGAVDAGSVCLDAGLYAVPAGDRGQDNWFYAEQACAARGGRLPTAGELVGAAPRVKLASRLDDDPAKATLDTDGSDGLRDLREMTSTLVTTRAGSEAAGSIGASEGATGDPRTGEPKPPTQPAETAPDSVQYLTVIDNGDRGGLAGALPITAPAPFRCAYLRGGTSTPAATSTPTPAKATAATVSAPKQITVAALRTSGLRALVECPKDCSWRVTLEVPQPRAFALKLTTSLSQSAVLARSGADPERLDAGSEATARLKVGAAIANRLKRSKSVKAQVTLVAALEGGKAKTIRQAVTLRR